MDKSYIEKRVKEWKKRIDALYASVKNSVSSLDNIKYKQDRHSIMYEELMKEYGVKKEQIPILDIYKNGEMIFSLKPIGLWVIGANGRIDILTKEGAYILVDSAKPDQPPKWMVYSPINRKSGAVFNSSFILNLISK